MRAPLFDEKRISSQVSGVWYTTFQNFFFDNTRMASSETPLANAWNPGLESDIPARLLPLVTMFREENASVSYEVAAELADLTGLKVLELAAFRPERLVVHALLVRVTADLSVPDGPTYELLGINLRGMVDTIYSSYMVPQMTGVIERFDAEMERARSFVVEQTSAGLFGDSSDQSQPEIRRTLLQRIFGRHPRPAVPKRNAEREHPEFRAIEDWKQLANTTDDSLEKSCLHVLVNIVGKVVAHRGRMILDQDQLTAIVVNQIGNTHGSDIINEFIEPFWQQAIDQERYKVLPAQSKPVVMNVKGASASGKSTIRPRQRKLAEELGIAWDHFALISPDYWRKYLLDYSSLGDDFKYSAMLTGRELELIDKKLDQYMAEKASRGLMSHLLIDRFRFDSFTVNIDRKPDSKLLSRFGDVVYLFFMVTHPAETVKRAWSRGNKTGRYKAVDDLLYHNVEAFTGMPSLFLSWVNSQDRKVHFEFLDNDVPEGELPRTVAFGWNGTMTILDVRLLINIDRYRGVNIAAKNAEQIFSGNPADDSSEGGFMAKCAEKIDNIVFADQRSCEIYASVVNGKLNWCNRSYIQNSADKALIEQVLTSLGSVESALSENSEHVPAPIDMDAEATVTVGRWGEFR